MIGKPHQQRLLQPALFNYQPVLVDVGMVRSMKIIWNAGIITYYCCQGDTGELWSGGYISFNSNQLDDMLKLDLFPWKIAESANSHAVLRWHPTRSGPTQTKCAVYGCARKLYSQCLCRPHCMQYRDILRWG